ncbi:MAG: SDR family oxidoreductase [Burkholderiales bacterium]|nr:SDR family oxidoreductase [Burkholderiales bacterium]
MVTGTEQLLAGVQARWLVTGGAGFIGSHLAEHLLRAGQDVVVLDNLSTGHFRNVELVQAAVGVDAAQRLRFVHGDICDLDACRHAITGADYVLHQAALGSVPRSIERPTDSNAANVTGFLNMLVAAKDARIRRFVYASSSAVYGDHPGLPKVEDAVGEVLSPYAATKRVNEMYARVFLRCYGLDTVGMRYFNVFGARQDPDGPYAAVIPRWVQAMLRGEPAWINGDGETTRDFCYVTNVVQANLRAALGTNAAIPGEVFNVAVHDRTSLNTLFRTLRELLAIDAPQVASAEPQYREFRAGDVRHSLADIGKAERLLGYRPTHSLRTGLEEALPWYVQQLK